MPDKLIKWSNTLIGLMIFGCVSVLAQEKEVVVPRDTSFTLYGTYVKESKRRPYIKMVLPDLPQGIAAFENIEYSRPYVGRSLLLNVYRPDDKRVYPALILVHGGGWSSGSLQMEVPMAQVVARKGYVTIPVEYRLSPEAGYPAAVYDLKTAVRWVKASAEKYGIDTTKIAISGTSAGGQLAALIGITNGQSQYECILEYPQYSSTVQAVINIDGITDFTDKAALASINEALAKGKMPAAVKWFGGGYEEKKKDWIAASSVFHITEHSVPICFINSSIDRFHDGRDQTIARLNSNNIYSEVHTLPDTPHPFWLFEPWFDITTEYMAAFLDKMFKAVSTLQ